MKQALALLLVVSSSLDAQTPATHAKSGEFKSPTPAARFRQGAGRDNLAHPPGYITAPLGTFGEVAVRGEGETDVILIAGLGPGWYVFDSFIEANGKDYRFFAVTLAGYGGSSAPPMPAPGTQFNEGTWLNGSKRALGTLIEERKLTRPLIVAFYSDAAHVALRYALENPDKVGGVLALSASPRFPLPPGRDRGPGMESFAQSWFKTVTEIMWPSGMWPADAYSMDAALSEKTWWDVLTPSLPTAIRYTVETWADDLVPDLVELKTPTIVLSPGFTEGYLDSPMGPTIRTRFHEGWEAAIDAGAHLEHVVVPDAHLLLWEDDPAEVQAALARLAK